jgi:ribosomal protein L37E
MDSRVDCERCGTDSFLHLERCGRNTRAGRQRCSMCGVPTPAWADRYELRRGTYERHSRIGLLCINHGEMLERALAEIARRGGR